MNTFWRKFSELGTSGTTNNPEYRSIILTNRINLVLLIIMIFLNIITSILRYIENGHMTIGTFRLVLVLIVCFIIIALNYYKLITPAKILLSTAPVFLLILLPTFYGFIETQSFFYYHIGILSLSIIPHLVFYPKPKNYIYPVIITIFFLITLFIDNLLIWFSKSNTSIIETIHSFRIFYKIIPIMVFIFVHAAFFHLRNINHKYFIEINNYTNNLNFTNIQLKQSNSIIQQQKEELETTLTHLKETQLQLIQAEKMASLGTLTAGIAHEINNPLNYLKGAYYGLESYFDDYGSNDNEKTGILLTGIQTGIAPISEIVKGLNLINRNNDNQTENCDIHTILDNCIAILINTNNYKADIIKHYTTENIIITGNNTKLHHAFINIITNALQSISDKGTVTVTTAIQNNQTIIEIIDTGIGIDKKHLNRITDPFFTTKPPGKGPGLGLSIAYTIVTELKGKIEFESEINTGTKVKLIFPLKKKSNET